MSLLEPVDVQELAKGVLEADANGVPLGDRAHGFLDCSGSPPDPSAGTRIASRARLARRAISEALTPAARAHASRSPASNTRSKKALRSENGRMSNAAHACF